jgi:hypothetical protein
MVPVEQIVCEQREEDNVWTEVRCDNRGMQRIIQYGHFLFYSSFNIVILTKSGWNIQYT